MKVGWIGLGEIGKHMALRVLDAGHDLVAYDRGAGKEEVAAKGARMTSDYAALAAGCEALCLCLFSDAQVRDVLFDQGTLAAMQPGSVLAIHTTGSPALAREIGERAPPGVSVLDACFSGGPHETANGDLTLMVGGDEQVLEKARPVLSTYASRINHMGPLGAGQTLKLLNNLLFATNLMQAAEILDIARTQGLDPQFAAKVICQSSGGSMAMGLLQNGPAELTLNAARHYMVKDVDAASEAAKDTGIDVSTFRKTLDYYR
ncbi:MAG: NAD(P)-dependent oxidoreductase [Novosphingobium sp.]|nr:NAD(P)-dependent oxidoreductase [Novosphingobium sp.]